VTIPRGLHRFLTVCIDCNLCRSSGTYVHVGFDAEEWESGGSGVSDG
jgi:hypothetical protein